MYIITTDTSRELKKISYFDILILTKIESFGHRNWNELPRQQNMFCFNHSSVLYMSNNSNVWDRKQVRRYALRKKRCHFKKIVAPGCTLTCHFDFIQIAPFLFQQTYALKRQL